jgi:hypothetical protein
MYDGMANEAAVNPVEVAFTVTVPCWPGSLYTGNCVVPLAGMYTVSVVTLDVGLNDPGPVSVTVA